MMRTILRSCGASVGAFIITGCAAPADHPEVRTVLDRQVQAWNRGDLEGFMQGYWKSDDLAFQTPQGITHGWQATLERYRRNYPTLERMGKLTFERLVVSTTGPDAAEVSGCYRVRRNDGDKTGRFYLHLRRIEGAWVIVKDQTISDQ